eukprot:2095161-Amphidinium_carterae.1
MRRHSRCRSISLPLVPLLGFSELPFYLHQFGIGNFQVHSQQCVAEVYVERAQTYQDYEDLLGPSAEQKFDFQGLEAAKNLFNERQKLWELVQQWQERSRQKLPHHSNKPSMQGRLEMHTVGGLSIAHCLAAD